MKKCPKCKAELQEEARFCLYCMTSFEEKQEDGAKPNNKWWLYGIAAFLLVSIIVLCLILFTPKKPKDSGKDTSSPSSVGSGLISSDEDESTPSADEQGGSSKGDSSTQESSGNGSSSTDNNSSEDKSSSGSSSNQTPQGGGEQGDGNEDDTSGSGSEDTSTEETAPTTPTTPETPDKEEDPPAGNNSTAVYLYRDATPADDFSANSSVTNGGVVITGVDTPSSNGVYEIPETIGGKKVVAVMNAAFCDSAVKDTVKTVIIPQNVKTINAYAFYYCYNLTDIYIKGEAVACPSVILPETAKRNFTITIHASKTCHDRNFRTYKTLCELYWDAAFEEWNG